MSADLINLNKVRKERQIQARKAQAEQNSVRFGRSKAQKHLEKTVSSREDSKLDSHKREP